MNQLQKDLSLSTTHQETQVAYEKASMRDADKSEKGNTMKALNEAKAEKWLAKEGRWNVAGTTTRSNFYSKYGIGKTQHTELYAKRKVNGCYAKLATPKTTYSIVTSEEGEIWEYDCPKIVFDYIIFAELTTDQVCKFQRQARENGK